MRVRVTGIGLILKALFSRKVTVDLGDILESCDVGGLILDIAAGGSGSGPKVLGEETVALDLSVSEIKDAIENQARAHWICADAKNMPFQGNLFDYAVTFAGLMYIKGEENKKQVLREALRVIRKDGKLVLVEPRIRKNSGGFIVKFQVLNKGKTIHSTGFGIAGKEIGQTPKLIKVIADKIRARFELLKEENNYFVITLSRH
jgi:ubiquinone/menaquinone biosynthesis C-methylase UbiE